MAMKRKIKFTHLPVILASTSRIRFCLLPVIKPSRKRTSEDIENPLPEDLSGKILDDLYLEQLIAVGSNGVLFRGLDIMDGNVYAVKIMIPGAKAKRAYLDEIASFDHLSRYPNCNEYIVCLYGHGEYTGSNSRRIRFTKDFRRRFKKYSTAKNKKMTPVSDDYLYLKMELMDMDLFSLVHFIQQEDAKKNDGISWVEEHPDIVKVLMLELLLALNALHSLGVAHLDIKLENILVKFAKNRTACDFYEHPNPKDIQLRIGDLGYTCTDKKNRKSMESNLSLCRPKGTPETAAPEIIRKIFPKRKPYLSLEDAQKADIWSMGITFGEMLFDPHIFKLPQDAKDYFDSEDEDKFIHMFNNFVHGKDQVEYVSGEPETDEIITGLFYEMLNYYPKERPNIKQAIEMLSKII